MTYTDRSFVEMLTTGFDYDYWANLRWYNAVRLMKNAEAASQVLQHILTTQRTWLERCGWPIEDIPRAATRAAFESASQAWKQLIATKPLDQTIDYTDRRGRAQSRQLGEIGWHVMNHGTFHRGHIRGLAGAEGFEEFADTDLVIFFDEQRKS